MIERLRMLSPRRRHPRSMLFSAYLDGDLPLGERRALESHVRDCARCRRVLDSLARTVDALGRLEPERALRMADSVIAALRAESPNETIPRAGQTPLLVVRPSVQSAAGARLRERARAALAFCCSRDQLRATLPLAVLAGVVLSLLNQTRMVTHAPLELATWVMCAPNFVVPFVALNVVLLILVWWPARRRSRVRRSHPA
jgi:hypothetical protein